MYYHIQPYYTVNCLKKNLLILMQNVIDVIFRTNKKFECVFFFQYLEIFKGIVYPFN